MMTILAIVLPLAIAAAITLIVWCCIAINQEDDE